MSTQIQKCPELEFGDKPWSQCQKLTRQGKQCKNPGCYDKKTRKYCNYCKRHMNHAQLILNEKKKEQERLDLEKRKNSLEDKIRELTIQNLDLTTKLKTQLPATNQTASTASIPSSSSSVQQNNEYNTWECFLEHSNEWVPYNKEIIDLLNREKSTTGKTQFIREGVKYTINWVDMEQENNATHFTRKIRQSKVTHPQLVYELSNDDGIRITPVTNKEALKILEQCLEIKSPGTWNPEQTHIDYTGNCTRFKFMLAWHCENQSLKTIYHKKRSRFLKSIPSQYNTKLEEVNNGLSSMLPAKDKLIRECNEKYLLHGTCPADIISIIKHGFNERFSGKNGSLFGPGVYFAEDEKFDQYVLRDQNQGIAGEYISTPASCRKAIKYMCEDLKELHEHLYKDFEHPRDVFYVLLSRVFLGHHIVTKDGIKIYTPHSMSNYGMYRSDRTKTEFVTNPATKLPFNSLIADADKDSYLNHREYVLKDGELAYPEYIICYKRENS